MKTYLQFIKENKEEVDFILKKYLYIIEGKVKDVKEGLNEFYFDFLNDQNFPVKFNLFITFIKDVSYKDYSGTFDLNSVKKNNWRNFDIHFKIYDDLVDYAELYSVINHELKHVYDYYIDPVLIEINKETGLKTLKDKYSNDPVFYDILFLTYIVLEHELSARNSQLYTYLKKFNTYDKQELNELFKKSYTYENIYELINCNLQINKNKLFNFTKDYLKLLYKHDIDDNFDMVDFWNYLENAFKENGKKYLIKANKVINDVALDIKPYMEKKTYKYDFFNKNETLKNIIYNCLLRFYFI